MFGRPAGTPTPSRPRHLGTEEWVEMLRYTLMRLGIFAGCLVVVWGLVYSGVVPRGLGDSNGMWIALLALVISAPISFVVLRGERDRASASVVRRVDRMKANLDANRSQEDGADEALRSRAQSAQAQEQAS
ncbi:putative membrane protein [Streptomyces griseoaurantiacus M045]|nr:putative membrane protein [Streptomyces griseoaurantiacus M045]